jgi:hypothetical protein
MEMRGFDMGHPKQPLSDADQSQFNTMKVCIQKALQPIIGRLEQGAGDVGEVV